MPAAASGPGDSAATPTPVSTPSVGSSSAGDGGKRGHSDQQDPVLLALLGGLAGAVLTIFGERLMESRKERAALSNLLGSVGEEVRANLSEARIRAKRETKDAFPFYAPLRVSSWTVLRTSGISWKLSDEPELFASLNAFYGEIEELNHKNSTAGALFGMMQQGGMSISDAKSYLEKAMQLVIDPYASLLMREQRCIALLIKRGI